MPARLGRIECCIGTFTHLSVKMFLLMDGQKLGLMETAERLLQKVPTEEKKLYIYAHSIF